MHRARTAFFGLLFLTSLASATGPFQVRLVNGQVSSLQNARDPHHTEFLAKDAKLGRVLLRYRVGTGDWKAFDSAAVAAGPPDLRVESGFTPVGSRLKWRIRVVNLSGQPLELAKLATPIATNSRFDSSATVKQCVLKHSFISAEGSFLYWTPSHGDGPYLLMTPTAGTSPEYWQATKDGYELYLHAKSEEETLRTYGTKWRIPLTGVKIPSGKSVDYGYDFTWADSYDGVRDALVRSDLLDVQVAPGMTVPTDLGADIAFRSKAGVRQVEAEFPADTVVQSLGQRGAYQHYRVQFHRLGENRLTVQFGAKRTYLEFFVTEPIETLIKKRAAFLTRSQHRDKSKWYDGLITDWNMETRVLLGPDNYDRIKGWRIYEVTCDDPGLAKPAFLAAKNVEYPDAREVEALDYYIKHFVWGGLQQTTEEPYPYGIYGIPDWHVLRNSPKKDRDGTEHLWRIYDYPHITLLYFSMYRIAQRHPELPMAMKATDYLRRAAGTAEAMFTVPMKIEKWSAYETGLYNELVIPDLIRELDAWGLTSEASRLRDHWSQKTKFFVAGNPDLFGSEYPFDSTGFESTQAFTRYALTNGEALGIPRKTAETFREKQMAANLLCRGVIEPAYYYYGSDYRGSAGDAYTLSYMAQMGGWAVLDYALHDAPKRSDLLRLGIGSYLSSWALMNTGTAASNYGYWYPGAENDGGAGGGFEPAAFGETWLGQPHHRGSWYYGCEIDLGFSGALRAAATVLADDPVFGRYCFLGTLRTVGKEYRVTPRDGLRTRFNLRLKSASGDVLLDGARFAKGKEIVVTPTSVRLPIELTATSGGRVTLSGFGTHAKFTFNGRPFTPGQRITESGELVVTDVKKP